MVQLLPLAFFASAVLGESHQGTQQWQKHSMETIETKIPITEAKESRSKRAALPTLSPRGQVGTLGEFDTKFEIGKDQWGNGFDEHSCQSREGEECEQGSRKDSGGTRRRDKEAGTGLTRARDAGRGERCSKEVGSPGESYQTLGHQQAQSFARAVCQAEDCGGRDGWQVGQFSQAHQGELPNAERTIHLTERRGHDPTSRTSREILNQQKSVSERAAVHEEEEDEPPDLNEEIEDLEAFEEDEEMDLEKPEGIEPTSPTKKRSALQPFGAPQKVQKT